MTSAFNIMFNDLMHQQDGDESLQQMKEEIEKDGVLAFEEARRWYLSLCERLCKRNK